VGLTHLDVRIANPATPRRAVKLKLLVDSGTLYSVVPEKVLRRIGVTPHSSRTFYLADGSEITRRLGDALFVLDGQRGASPVIFGQAGDAGLLGVVSLEALGLILDPMKRVLRPLPMLFG
jgi:predicted aspartyl protease